MRLIDFKGHVKFSEVTDPELLKDIQERLRVRIDGLQGPETQRAFIDFKKRNHLGEPEWLGPSTAQALLRSSPDIISAAQARAVFGRTPTEAQLRDLNAAMKKADITTPARINHFLAQVGHESGGLRWLLELASGVAYNGRRDLGNIYAGDGPRYKGAGAIQLTGRNNYTRFGQWIDDPEVVRQGAKYVASKYPFSSAAWWWTANRMNQRVDAGSTVKQLTRVVNGGYNGLDDRLAYYKKAVQVIA